MKKETQEKLIKYNMTHIDFWNEESAESLIKAFEGINNKVK